MCVQPSYPPQRTALSSAPHRPAVRRSASPRLFYMNIRSALPRSARAVSIEAERRFRA